MISEQLGNLALRMRAKLGRRSRSAAAGFAATEARWGIYGCWGSAARLRGMAVVIHGGVRPEAHGLIDSDAYTHFHAHSLSTHTHTTGMNKYIYKHMYKYTHARAHKYTKNTHTQL